MASGATYEFALGDALLRVRAWSGSDVGRVRRVNEDSYLATAPVFLVADGMGGHALGDRASQTVVEEFCARFTDAAPTTPDAVAAAVAGAHDAVAALTVETGDARSIAGTTLTGVALVDLGAEHPERYRWMVFNVGDSRVYAWDGAALAQLTVDHSAVQELLSRGLIAPAQIAKHPQRNVITRAVGVDDVVNADAWLIPVGGRQSYLICSDGLTKELADEEIAAVLRDSAAAFGGEARGELNGDPAERLVAAALAAGGRDNVTVVVLDSELDAGSVPGDGTGRIATILPESLEDTLPRNRRA